MPGIIVAHDWMEHSRRLKVACLTVLVVVGVLLGNATCARAWGWLMAGHWSSAGGDGFALPCDATYCVRSPSANASMPLHLHRCVGVRFWKEQFSFDDYDDDGAHFVMSTDSDGVHSCLDVREDGRTVGLRDCNPASPSQRWSFHGSQLQNGQGLFLMALGPLAPFDSDVPLIVGEEPYDNTTTGTSDWTFVDSSDVGADFSKPILPSSRSANLVRNDQFLENWGESQSQGAPGDMTLLCQWTILGESPTSLVRNPSGGWNVILGAISQTVPTHPGLPHTLRFIVKKNDACRANGDAAAAAAKVLVSLLPSSSELNMIEVDRTSDLWKAEELRFVAVNNMVNLTFANVGGENSSCSIAIGNIEVGLEDDYLIAEVSDKLWTSALYLYSIAGFFGVVVLSVLVVHVAGSLRSRKLK